MSLFVPTPGLFWPSPGGFGPTVSFGNTSVIDASGEKIAFIGRMWNKDGTSKSIRKVGFLLSTVVKDPLSTFTVSLQDVSASGPVMQPDETQDQTVAIAAGDAGFITNAWYQTAAFSADRAVAFGELLSVVLEFNNFVAGDSVMLRGITRSGAISADQASCPVSKIGGTWTANNTLSNNLVLEFSDGTFGMLGLNAITMPVHSSAASSGNALSSATTPDERALRFIAPFDCYCDGAFFALVINNSSSDFDINLYHGTTLLAQKVYDANQVAAISSGTFYPNWTPVLLSRGEEYFLSVRGLSTGVNTVAPQSLTVNDANHFQCHPGGTGVYQATRVDGGAWSASLTTRLLAGISISSVDAEAGGGGGGGSPLISLLGQSVM